MSGMKDGESAKSNDNEPSSKSRSFLSRRSLLSGTDLISGKPRFPEQLRFPFFEELKLTEQFKTSIADEVKQLKIPFVSNDLISLKIESPFEKIIDAEKIATSHLKELFEAWTVQDQAIKRIVAADESVVKSLKQTNGLWSQFNENSQKQLTFYFKTSKATEKQIFELSSWAETYGKLYFRIAQELKRQREQLEALLSQFKSSISNISEKELLLELYRCVCLKSEEVHNRLCFLEKATALNFNCEDEWLIETISELRLDHMRMDDALSKIGEVTLLELGQDKGCISLFHLNTMRRLKIFQEELERIDKELLVLIMK